MSNNKPIILFDVDDTLFDTGVFRNSEFTQFQLYPDVVTALTELSSLATLGIFSESKYELQEGKLSKTDGILTPGAYEFQMSKITKTDILRFFSKEHIHIVGDKSDASQRVLLPYEKENAYFVDDKLPMLHLAAGFLPHLQTIWVRRGPFSAAQQPISGFVPNYTIDSLTEIRLLMQK